MTSSFLIFIQIAISIITWHSNYTSLSLNSINHISTHSYKYQCSNSDAFCKYAIADRAWKTFPFKLTAIFLFSSSLRLCRKIHWRSPRFIAQGDYSEIIMKKRRTQMVHFFLSHSIRSIESLYFWMNTYFSN